MSSCPSCNEGYDRETRQPRMLHCGHALCTPCLLQLHRLNYCVISCPCCGREDHYKDVSQLTIMDLEARVESLSLEGKEKEMVAVEGEESPWDICSLHGGPLSSWCTTCRHAVCSDCEQLHGGLHHQVVDYRRAKELLLSRYEDESRAFLEWLVKVEAATRTTLEAAEAALPPLRQTLSVLGIHIGRMRSHAETLEGAVSLETLEDLLEKRSRWSKKTRTATQLQVDAAVSTLGRLESAAANLRRLQREFEDCFARAGNPAAAGASLPQEEGRNERRLEVAQPATRRIVVADTVNPFTLALCQKRHLSLPRGVGTGCLSRRCIATHVHFKIQTPGTSVDGLSVFHWNSSGCLIFSVHWDFGSDHTVMEALDPTTKKMKASALPREGCGLLWGTLHRARIEVDRGQFEVFLDGNSMGRIEIAGGLSNIAEAGRIEVKSDFCEVQVSKFFVETYGPFAVTS